jgi:hypothetical protein
MSYTPTSASKCVGLSVQSRPHNLTLKDQVPIDCLSAITCLRPQFTLPLLLLNLPLLFRRVIFVLLVCTQVSAECCVHNKIFEL